jgi:hypothetical protein
MDDEDEPITIDHLLGANCILNASLRVVLRRNRRKDNRIELYTDGTRHYLLVVAVTDFSADGGYVITIANRRGEVLSDKGLLILESLFKRKNKTGATI